MAAEGDRLLHAGKGGLSLIPGYRCFSRMDCTFRLLTAAGSPPPHTHPLTNPTHPTPGLDCPLSYVCVFIWKEMAMFQAHVSCASRGGVGAQEVRGGGANH